MRIYGYALGGNTIFFRRHGSTCTDKCHPNRYRCRAHVAEESSGEDVMKTFSDERVKESKHRPENDWQRSGDLDLELLLTCRQIYNEALLVPFSANDLGVHSTWSTSNNHTMILFLRDLIPDQIRAISTLHIRGMVRHGFVQQHVKALSGLRRLKFGFDWNVMAIRGSPDLLMTTLEKHFETSGVIMFAMANLQTVDFTIDLTVFFRDVQAVLAQEKELVDWIESKRTLLLAKQAPATRTRRAAIVTSQATRASGRIRAQKEKAKASAEE